MDHYGTSGTDRPESSADRPESPDQLPEAPRSARLRRKARRYAFWSDLADSLLSIPPGIAARLGG